MWVAEHQVQTRCGCGASGPTSAGAAGPEVGHRVQHDAPAAQHPGALAEHGGGVGDYSSRVAATTVSNTADAKGRRRQPGSSCTHCTESAPRPGSAGFSTAQTSSRSASRPSSRSTWRNNWSAWRRRHQHGARQAHQRWNAYAETSPVITTNDSCRIRTYAPR